MAHYLVTAKPQKDLLPELRNRLKNGEIENMEPFGESLQYSLENAKLKADGGAVWEEEDYCRPPLAQERAAILDKYFSELQVQRVEEGKGWDQIDDLDGMFAKLLKDKK